MDDIHIIQNKDDEIKEKKKTSKNGVLLSLVALIAVISFGAANHYLLNQSVKGVRTETKGESIRFEPPTKDQGNNSMTTETITQTGTPFATEKDSLPKILIIYSEGMLDGSISNNQVVTNNEAIILGNTGTEIDRGIVSFSLKDLPQGVQIRKATLRLYQTKIEGTPFSNLGQVTFDHVELGSSLDASDYMRDGITESFARLPQSTSVGWKEVDVTKRVKEDLTNVQTSSQFRIHFTNEEVSKDGSTNSISFESSENFNQSGNIPQLVISY